MALSADGSELAVGAPEEDGAGTGGGGDPADDSKYKSGAVYLLENVAAGGGTVPLSAPATGRLGDVGRLAP